MDICDKSLCTGCGMCVNICPQKCLELREDEIGHLYPHADDKKCTECGLCKKRCPVNNKPVLYPTHKVYAAWSKDKSDRKSSTSGGFASVAARKIIENHGIVYGCALTQNGICHIRIDDKKDLNRLKGSKYVQSPIVHIYDSLKKDLQNGIPVLFIGTPCQTAGIKAYLNREYDNLIAIDLICTGAPPQKLLWEHLGYMPEKLSEISFRDSTGSRLTVKDEDTTVYSQPVYNDYFYMGFSKHLYLRESCCRCEFLGKERASDITIGDFWGLGRIDPFGYDISDGVSVVITHSGKGSRIVDLCSDSLFLQERTMEETLKFNPRYTSASSAHQNAALFKKLYVKKGFKYALKKSLKKERVRYFLYRNILRRIKRGGK